ncbi:MAG: hypothetical protein WCW44_03835 [archaeon]|jgi:hypothetical protein
MEYFDEVSEKDIEQTARAITASKGRAVLIVHPFDPSNREMHPNTAYEQKTREYETALVNAMKATKLPILLFEEYPVIEKTRKRLAKAGVKALILPTKKGFCMLNERNDNSFSREPIIRLLASFGLRHAFIGGSYTESNYAQEVWEHEAKLGAKRTVPSIKTVSKGCAGGLYWDLIRSGQFEAIRLMPNLLFGDKPKRIKTKTNVIDRRRTVITRKFQRQINAHLFKR